MSCKKNSNSATYVTSAAISRLMKRRTPRISQTVSINTHKLYLSTAQDNQSNQPTNQNTNQQPNSQQQGQQSKQNKQSTIRFITAGKRQDQNDENPGGNMLQKLLDDFEKNTLRRVELTKKCNDEKYWIERKGKYFCKLYKENKNTNPLLWNDQARRSTLELKRHC
ncbi:Hypothetical_protein [Hexamita inflata]|uniref:Hypothetical_protein n=1 Tax=Hexamita inflata TaxID=28002 RepID=A0AA86RLD7_9EUKA|nr:Hypothetical protein HINF_LOCUS61657 [Hexamita inflata]